MNGLFTHGFDAPPQNMFGPIGSHGPMHSSSSSNASTNSDQTDSFLWLGAVGGSLPSSSSYSPPSTDEYVPAIPYVPESVAFANVCGNCEGLTPENHCFDCGDSLCNRCVIIHLRHYSYKHHTIQKITNSSPPVSGRYMNNYPTPSPPPPKVELENQCDMHYEVMRYVCDHCKILVCQECTLRDHKDHQCTAIEKYIERPPAIIQTLMDRGSSGKQQIKQNIDRILQFSQHLERDTNEVITRARKNGLRVGSASTIQQGIRNEEQERAIIDIIEKFRQQKITNYHDQTSGLRAALAGIASVTDDLKKLSGTFAELNNFQLVKSLVESDHKIEHFLKQTRKLSPTPVNVNQFIQTIDMSSGMPVTMEENLINGLQRIMQQANTSHVSLTAPSTSSMNGNTSTMNLIGNNNNNGPRNHRRPITRNNRTYQNNNQMMPAPIGAIGGISNWNSPSPMNNSGDLNLFGLNSSPSRFQLNASNRSIPEEPRSYGRCIFNSDAPVNLVQRMAPSHTFAFDGPLEGQLSRPWGVCVDKDGNIIIGDRRNNRIQIFYPDGTFKFAFGTKGSGDGQLELPAGVTTDRQNRIIVADKDNHRIQIFSATGRYILKFGGFGRDLGEFQYPWDVAVNSIGNIIVTDTRNHRIQMFTSTGNFVTKFSFDNAYYDKMVKSHITPRGLCFTPTGDILITDFENHRIMKMDGNLTMVRFFSP